MGRFVWGMNGSCKWSSLVLSSLEIFFNRSLDTRTENSFIVQLIAHNTELDIILNFTLSGSCYSGLCLLTCTSFGNASQIKFTVCLSLTRKRTKVLITDFWHECNFQKNVSPVFFLIGNCQCGTGASRGGFKGGL